MEDKGGMRTWGRTKRTSWFYSGRYRVSYILLGVSHLLIYWVSMNDYKLTRRVSMFSTSIVITDHCVISAYLRWCVVLIIEQCWLKPNTACNLYYPIVLHRSMTFQPIITYTCLMSDKAGPSQDHVPNTNAHVGIMWLTILSYLMIRTSTQKTEKDIRVRDITPLLRD